MNNIYKKIIQYFIYIYISKLKKKLNFIYILQKSYEITP